VRTLEPGLVTTPQLDRWASQWDHLVDLSPVPTPFLRSWWLEAAAGSKPLFLLIVDGDELLGGLAIEEGRRLGVPWLRMMGTGSLCPDHLDLLTLPGHEDAVVRVIRAWLARPRAAPLDMEGVPVGSWLISTLPGYVRTESQAQAPWTPLPRDMSDYPAGLRKTLRRTAARLTAEGAAHRVHRGSSVASALPTLRSLHEAQWGDRSRFLPEFDRFAAACRLGARFDEVAVHELHVGELVVANMVSFEVARRVSLYQSARLTQARWRDATTLLLHTVIADASDRGFAEVDFLRGDEAYKSNFAPERRELLRLRTATCWIGRAVLACETAARTAKHMSRARTPAT
jgi:Acetyltransferase (GNAT) domain